MLQAGRQADGYSLVELLAVIAVVAVIAALASTPFVTSRARLTAQTSVASLTDALRQARERAVTGTPKVQFVLDVEHKKYHVTGTPIRAALPPESKLTFRTALNQVVSNQTAKIRFYPDGTTSGGAILLAIDDRTWEFNVSWLTGRVSMTEKER